MKKTKMKTMKSLNSFLVICFLFIYSQRVFSKLIIISDIDDTIRRTETINPLQALTNLMIVKVPAYEGIRKMYWDLWATRPQVEFFYLSSSLKDIYDADEWLGHTQFPLGITTQRSREVFLKQSEEKYKIESIIHFLKDESADTEVYFFGDTSFSDETIYTEVV